MKLHSFIRVLDTQPAPVIPIFVDESGDYFQQKIGELENIYGFQKIETEDKNRSIIHVQNQIVEKNVGDNALFAIEYREKQVRFGSKNTIKNSIIEFSKGKIFKNHPFTLLEYAILVQSEDLIEAALLECKRSLESISPILFTKWIDGSDINQKYKKFLESKLESDSENIHLSFCSTFHALINLTEFSRVYLKQYRKYTLNKAIDDIIADEFSFLDKNKIASFFNSFLKASEDLISSDKDLELSYTFYSSESRGNIKLEKSRYNRFLRIIDNSIPSIIKMLPEMSKDERKFINLFFLSNRSRIITMIFYIYYAHRFGEFEKFIEKQIFLPPFFVKDFKITDI